MHPGRKGQQLCAKLSDSYIPLTFPYRRIKAQRSHFWVIYDGLFTREALSLMTRSAKIKYPETQGCRNYLVMRANWIDHWVKGIQSSLVNSLARGMVRSYTDLTAQHAVTRDDRQQTLSPPPVPQGLPRFTSRGIAHTSQEAFPPYLQPTMTCIDGAKPTMLDHMVPKVTAVETPSIFARLSRRTSLSVSHERSLQVTPPRRPTDR